VYTARQIADLDHLSGGRFDLGIGVGWLREEFDALGVPWERRGARTEECLGVMKSLWCDEVSSYDGTFYSLPPCVQSPKPVQAPHPPLIFGGESDATFRRIAAMGQGWFAFGFAPDAMKGALDSLDAALASVGRDRADVQIHAAPPAGRLDAEALGAYEALGVDQLILPLLAGSVQKLARRADRLAEQVAAYL
jgi:probable F420-dependent oxidoreductase